MTTEPFDIDVKRFYLPGAVLRAPCPDCRGTAECDFGHDYLSYPKANAPIRVWLNCEKCGDWKEFKAVLTVSLALVER